MKQETMYDVKKQTIKKEKEFYKDRKRVIKLQKKDLTMENTANYIASGLSLLGSISIAGFGSISQTNNKIYYAGALLLAICGIIPLITNKKIRNEKLVELKEQERKIDKLIKEQKITREEKKKLETYKVKHI